MFKKVLFPTDFSKPAMNELHCITSIPGIREIILLYVIRHYAIPMGRETVETLESSTAEVYLHEAKKYITTLNPDIRVSLEETTSRDLTDAILETAEKHKVDIVVIHGYIKGIMAGLLRGCVPEKVLCRVSKTNIMIMPNILVESLTGKNFEKFCPMIFSRILCPVNFSERSEKTSALAGSMKGVGEIILLHSVHKGKEGQDHKETVTTAENQIKKICKQIVGQGIKTRTMVVTGKPEHEIPRIAEEEDVSLIWMGGAGKGCLHDFFFGSTVHEVLLKSKRPVIVIRSHQ
jgi:nucleotide-binding universal stress UspA family protein